MSNKQQFNARIRHKTGKYADWEQAANSFKPLLGEIIVYIPDDANDTRPIRLKVGDGEKFINELDFITNPDGETSSEINVDSEITADSKNPVSSAAIYTALQNITAKEADAVDGYHFNVSTEIPTPDSVTDYTITFVI